MIEPFFSSLVAVTFTFTPSRECAGVSPSLPLVLFLPFTNTCRSEHPFQFTGAQHRRYPGSPCITIKRRVEISTGREALRTFELRTPYKFISVVCLTTVTAPPCACHT